MHRRLERQHRRLGQRQGSADQHQPDDPFRVGHRHPPGGEAAPRVTDQGGALNSGGVQEGHSVGGEIVDGVAAAGSFGVAVAALVQGKGMEAGREQRQHPAVGEPGVGVGGQEQDRLAVRVALLGVVHLRAGGQAGDRKPQSPIGVVHVPLQYLAATGCHPTAS
jgi:hypothetical protein